MRRILLQSQNQENQGRENIDTTPLRRSSVGLPRLRVLEKDFNSEVTPKAAGFSHPSTVTKLAPQIVKPYPYSYPRQTWADDRFIRPKKNLDIANYLLKKKTEADTVEENELDVFKQVDSLPVTWRKKLMHQLMVKENIIPGLGQKHVLQRSHLSSENKVAGSLAGRPKELLGEECREDGMWTSKPRKKPLIGTMESILEMPGFRTSPQRRKTHLDWGSNNLIAVGLHDSITLYDTTAPDAMESQKNLKIVNVCALKWSSSGEKLVTCTLLSEVILYSLQSEKIIWTMKCKKAVKYERPCIVRCICWSQSDQHIVTGCNGIISVFLAKNGTIVDSTNAHDGAILALAFSSSYRYLASSGLDYNVRIFTWPDLFPHLELTYRELVKAMAWHPEESGLLCTGGGMGDASLSLWNANKLCQVSYRHVKFSGGVENLAWNKHSGELVVHWTYLEGQQQKTVMPVLVSLDCIVDEVPVDRELRFHTLMWNCDQTQIAVQHDGCLALWNFFGDTDLYRKHNTPRESQAVQNNSSSRNFREFSTFTIR